MQAPSLMHQMAVKRIIRYLGGTLSHSLFLRRCSFFNLYAYSDEDWAGFPMVVALEVCFCIYFGPNLTSQNSRMHNTVFKARISKSYMLHYEQYGCNNCWGSYIFLQIEYLLYDAITLVLPFSFPILSYLPEQNTWKLTFTLFMKMWLTNRFFIQHNITSDQIDDVLILINKITVFSK